MQKNIKNTTTDGGTPRQLTEIEKETINSYSISNEAKQLVEEYWATKSSPMLQEPKKKWIRIFIIFWCVIMGMSFTILLGQYFLSEMFPKIAITIALIYVWIEIVSGIFMGIRGITLFLRFRYMFNTQSDFGVMHSLRELKEALDPGILQIFQRKYVLKIGINTLYRLGLFALLVLNAYTVAAIFLMISICGIGISILLMRNLFKDVIGALLIKW